MLRDEIEAYELVGKLKEALMNILEESESQDREWSVIIEEVGRALDYFED